MIRLGASLGDAKEVFYIIDEINLRKENIIKKHCRGDKL